MRLPVASAPDVEGLSAQELIAYAVERFHPRLYLACSFQKESSVLLDMLLEAEPAARVFTLDTDLLFDETHGTRRRLEQRYGISIDVYRGISLEEQAAQHGDALWDRDPDACCGLRKVAPMQRALDGVDAWITGLRREQGPTRADTETVAVDGKRGGIAKYSPLAHWTERDLWARIHERGLPYHPLHDAGYESIGCAPCTRPGSAREGRWSGTDKTECGLHVLARDPR